MEPEVTKFMAENFEKNVIEDANTSYDRRP